MTSEFIRGSESWVTDRDYTRVDNVRHFTVDDIFSYLKTFMIDEGIVSVPKTYDDDGVASRRVPSSDIDLNEEALAFKCEAFRPYTF